MRWLLCHSTCFILIFINLCLLTDEMQIMRASALLCCCEKSQHIKHAKFLTICLGHSKWSEVKWSEVKVAQLCPTLCDPMSYTIHGILHAKILENIGVGSLSLLQGIFPTQGLNPGLLHCRWILYQLSHKGTSRIMEWVALYFLQRIFLTQESNQGLLWRYLHCRQILYQLSYEGNPIYAYIYTKESIQLKMRIKDNRSKYIIILK